jgi:5-methylthioadenosine/S-adenosylhomocysteine deaminase
MRDHKLGRMPGPIFFDLKGTLVDETPQGFVLRSGVKEWMSLASDNRLGVLCNMGAGRSREIRFILEAVRIYEHFTADLLINASDLPVQLPDRRVFAVAAALAEADIEQCLYITNDKRLRPAALAAGMRVETLSPSAPVELIRAAPSTLGATESAAPGLLADIAEPAVVVPVATLLAGEIDEDTGPTFVLKGRIVTMNSGNEVIENGRLVVRRGKIATVLKPTQALPPEFNSAPAVETGGTIYPGLIDLHNHFVYNVLPLWAVPREYQNRTQWPRAQTYGPTISLPIRALAGYSRTARAIVRYVEAKALIGGTTTGQGIRTRVQGGIRLFEGAMRNVEETHDERLPEAATLVPNLKNDPDSIESFRRGLENRKAYFYHLCEGKDPGTRRYFTQLTENELIRESLVGIHSLALNSEDLSTLAESKAKVVWSPFSNLLLYGKTLDLGALKESGVTFSIGCDWSPSGSKNLLQELKVARHVVETQDANFTSRDLVRAVTVNAAAVVGWQAYLGVLKRNAMADILVIDGTGGDPYDQLIDATEAAVKLVIVHGIARYGDPGLMQALDASPGHPRELLTVAGAQKAFQLFRADSDLADQTVKGSRDILRDAMSDLPAFLETSGTETAHLLALGVENPQPFVLELDMEFVPSPDDELEPEAATLLADWDSIAESIDLDALEVNTDAYWPLIEAQNNISPELKEMLKNAYQ